MTQEHHTNNSAAEAATPTAHDTMTMEVTMSESKRITLAAANAAVQAAEAGKNSRMLYDAEDEVETYRKALRFARRHGLTVHKLQVHGGCVPNSYRYRAESTYLELSPRDGVRAYRGSAPKRRFADGPTHAVGFAIPDGDDRRGPDFPAFDGHESPRREGSTLWYRW